MRRDYLIDDLLEGTLSNDELFVFWVSLRDLFPFTPFFPLVQKNRHSIPPSRFSLPSPSPRFVVVLFFFESLLCSHLGLRLHYEK